MTISSTTNRWDYEGDGSTTDFTYNNKIFAGSDLNVYVDSVLKTLNSDYTVSGAGSDSGGTVAFAVAPADESDIVIIRSVPFTQPTDFPAGGAFPSSSAEDAHDRAVIHVQQLKELSDRTLKAPESDSINNQNYDAEGRRIQSLGTPTSSNDAANKAYVDLTVAAAEQGVTPDTLTLTVDSTAELEAIGTGSFTGGERRILAETASGEGDGGVAIFRAGDQSSNVSNYPQNWFVPNDRASDGSGGAWQRSVGVPENVSQTVDTAAALKAIPAANFSGKERRILAETTSGKSDGSIVVFRTGDQSAGVAAKPSDWFVPDDLAANGSEGAWQRMHFTHGGPVMLESGSISAASDLEFDLSSTRYTLPDGSRPKRMTIRLRNIEQQIGGADIYAVFKSASVVYGTSGNGDTNCWTTFSGSTSGGSQFAATGFADTWRVMVGDDVAAFAPSGNLHQYEMILENPFNVFGRKRGFSKLAFVTHSTSEVAHYNGSWLWEGDDLGEALTGLKFIADGTTLTLDYEVYGE